MSRCSSSSTSHLTTASTSSPSTAWSEVSPTWRPLRQASSGICLPLFILSIFFISLFYIYFNFLTSAAASTRPTRPTPSGRRPGEAGQCGEYQGQLPEVRHIVQIGDYNWPDGPSPNGTYSDTDVITWDKLLQVVGIQKRSLSPLFIFCFLLLYPKMVLNRVAQYCNANIYSFEVFLQQNSGHGSLQ